MLTLLKKWQNKDTPERASLEASPPEKCVIRAVKPGANEEVLKKRIASKLQTYQPLNRESNFTGPKYHG